MSDNPAVILAIEILSSSGKFASYKIIISQSLIKKVLALISVQYWWRLRQVSYTSINSRQIFPITRPPQSPLDQDIMTLPAAPRILNEAGHEAPVPRISNHSLLLISLRINAISSCMWLECVVIVTRSTPFPLIPSDYGE